MHPHELTEWKRYALLELYLKPHDRNIMALVVLLQQIEHMQQTLTQIHDTCIGVTPERAIMVVPRVVDLTRTYR